MLRSEVAVSSLSLFAIGFESVGNLSRDTRHSPAVKLGIELGPADFIVT